MDQLVDPSRKSLADFQLLYRSSLDRYTFRNGLLYYTVFVGDTSGVVVPAHDDLRPRSIYEFHDTLIDENFGRENAYLIVSRNVW